MKFKEYAEQATPYVMLTSLFLMNILLVLGVTRLLFGGNQTIIAGVIGFIGAVIGGALTLIGVKWTLESQSEKEDNRKFESNKTYLSASTTVFNFNESNKIGRLSKHRVLITSSVNQLDAFNKNIPYYSIVRYGGSEVVTNCHFVVTVGKDAEFKNTDKIEVWTDYFEKDEEILIPLCSAKLHEIHPWVKDVKVTFSTLNNDKIIFTQSEIDNKRNHVFYQGDNSEMLGLDTKYTTWTQKGKSSQNA